MIEATATTPATSAAPKARRRKYSTMSASPRRRASQIRYVAARNEQAVTARTPPRIDAGFSQLDQGSPASPPEGTRPEAMAPATAPSEYGTSTDAAANAAPKFRWSRVRKTALRK